MIFERIDGNLKSKIVNSKRVELQIWVTHLCGLALLEIPQALLNSKENFEWTEPLPHQRYCTPLQRARYRLHRDDPDPNRFETPT